MHEPVSDLPNLLFLDHALKASRMLSGVSGLLGGYCRVDVWSSGTQFPFASGLTCFISCACVPCSPTTNLQSCCLLVQSPRQPLSLHKRAPFLNLIYPFHTCTEYISVRSLHITLSYPRSPSAPTSSCQRIRLLLSGLCTGLTH